MVIITEWDRLGREKLSDLVGVFSTNTKAWEYLTKAETISAEDGWTMRRFRNFQKDYALHYRAFNRLIQKFDGAAFRQDGRVRYVVLNVLKNPSPDDVQEWRLSRADFDG